MKLRNRLSKKIMSEEKQMDFLQDKIKKKQFLCNYSVFLLNGMLALSIGSLLPFIRDARGLDYAFWADKY